MNIFQKIRSWFTKDDDDDNLPPPTAPVLLNPHYPDLKDIEDPQSRGLMKILALCQRGINVQTRKINESRANSC